MVLAVNSIIHSKTFDNGMICASEQSVIVLDPVYKAVKDEFKKRGCYFLNKEETEKVRKTIIINGSVNAKIVGQRAHTIAAMAGVDVPENTKILIGEVESVDISEEFAHEKLSPVLAMYHAKTFDEAIEKAEHLIADGGYGHTSSLYINVAEKEKLAKHQAAIEDLPHPGEHPLLPGRYRRPVQLQAGSLPHPGLRLLGRQLRFRERGCQAPD